MGEAIQQGIIIFILSCIPVVAIFILTSYTVTVAVLVFIIVCTFYGGMLTLLAISK